MNVPGMLAELNQEIARLTQIRDLLGRTAVPAKPGSGHPEGSSQQAGATKSSKGAPERQSMSAEAREKIAAAQRKRWASVSKPGIVKTLRAVPARASGKAGTAQKAAVERLPPKKATKQTLA